MKSGLYEVSPFILQNLIWVPTRFVYKFFAHFKIRGGENLSGLPKGVIFAVNHSSELDPITLTGALPFMSRFYPMFYVSREKSFYKKSGWRQKIYGGLFFKAWGAYPAYPGLKNYSQSLINHIKLLIDSKSVCIFPEGVRTKNGTIGDGKGGVAYLSWATGRPIVPVGINGSFHCDIISFFSRKKHIGLTFGHPIYPRELFARNGIEPTVGENIDDFTDAAALIMEQIKQLAGQANAIQESVPPLVPNFTAPLNKK